MKPEFSRQSCSMRTDGRTDRHDESDCCYPQFCERANKLSSLRCATNCTAEVDMAFSCAVCRVRQRLVLHHGNLDGAHTFLREKITCSLPERTVWMWHALINSWKPLALHLEQLREISSSWSLFHEVCNIDYRKYSKMGQACSMHGKDKNAHHLESAEKNRPLGRREL